jgi:flagellar biosynthesis protein FlhF
MHSSEAISKIVSILEENDFSAGYIKKIAEKLNQQYADCENVEFESVKKTSMDIVGTDSPIALPQNSKKLRVIFMVGAAGSGKTVSLIKMAAKLIKDASDKKTKRPEILLVAADCKRIAADEKINRFGFLLDAKVEKAESAADVQRIVQNYSEKVDAIFVDVSTENQGEICKLFAKDSEIYHIIPATMKTSVIEREIKKYGANFAIVTKADETNCYGNVISAIAGTGMKIAYISNGENIPRDFKEAAAKDFLPAEERDLQH